MEVMCMHTCIREVLRYLREDGIAVTQGLQDLLAFLQGLLACLQGLQACQDRLHNCLDLSQSWGCQCPRCRCTSNSSSIHYKQGMTQIKKVMSCSLACITSVST